MVAVVTGSTGFIGSHLVEALLAAGAEVRALRRPFSSAVPWTKVVSHTADLLDASAVASCAVWDGATHCFHLAAATNGRTAAEFARGNVIPTRNVVAAIRARGVHGPRLVYVSSQAAAGPASDATAPRRESDVSAPVEGYGASKLEAERVIAAAAPQVRATIVRPSTVYGPGDRDLLNAFRQATSRVAIYAAPADQQFSIVFVRDLVSALLQAAAQPVAVGNTYFVANATPVTWRELYRLVADIAGASPVELQLPGRLLAAAARVADRWPVRGTRPPLLTVHKVALSRPRWWLCDASRARRDLGWTPSVPLDAGLRETFAWYCTAGWLKAA